MDGHDLVAELAARVGRRRIRAGGHRRALAANSRWEYDDLPYWGGEVDCCINAWTLANGVWLGADVEGIAGWFVDHRLTDGGWNCEWVDGSTRSSFHSALNSLKGLLAHEAATGGTERTRAARHAGEVYLLERRLLHRRSIGEMVAPWVMRLAHLGRRWSWSTAMSRFQSGLSATWCKAGLCPVSSG